MCILNVIWDIFNFIKSSILIDVQLQTMEGPRVLVVWISLEKFAAFTYTQI